VATVCTWASDSALTETVDEFTVIMLQCSEEWNLKKNCDDSNLWRFTCNISSSEVLSRRPVLTLGKVTIVRSVQQSASSVLQLCHDYPWTYLSDVASIVG